MSILIVILIIYVSITLLFYFLQHLFFFRPEILPHDFKYQYPFPFEEKQFDLPDGGRINAIWFKVPNSLGVVYFLKGNSRSIKGWGKFAKDYVGKGYDFFMMDYRGFGKSRGHRSEQIIYSDAEYVYNWLSTQYDQSKIVVLGRSLGSGFAARVAAWNHPKMLILDSPYYSFQYQIHRFGWWLPLRWILRYKIPTYMYIQKVNCPVYIIHGDKDFLISYEQGVRLQQVIPEKATLITIKGAHHNNLPKFEAYHKALYKILNA
jgi:pimeloyl-ACP methyl ester carboxylesterase